MLIFGREDTFLDFFRKEVMKITKIKIKKKQERTQQNGYDIRDQRPRITPKRY